jgi:hypothetical protein
MGVIIVRFIKPQSRISADRAVVGECAAGT